MQLGFNKTKIHKQLIIKKKKYDYKIAQTTIFMYKKSKIKSYILKIYLIVKNKKQSNKKLYKRNNNLFIL